MNRIIRVVAIAMVPLVLWAGWTALSWGIAGRYDVDARRLAYNIEVTDEDYAANVQRSVEFGRKAVQWHPTHPEYLYLLARQLLIRGQVEAQPSDYVEARQMIDRSLAERPEWPPTWALLVRLKATAGEIDSELSDAMIAAATYGPWEQDVLVALAQVGTANFARLSDAAQDEVLGAIRRGLKGRGTRADLVARLVQLGVLGWTPEFVAGMLGILAVEDWTISPRAHALTALTLWPVADREARKSLAVKLAQVVGEARLPLQEIREAGADDFLCLYLPRTGRLYNRLCGNVF